MNIDIPLPVLLALGVCAVITVYFYVFIFKGPKTVGKERFEEQSLGVESESAEPKGNESLDDEQYRAVDYESSQSPYPQRDTNTVQDLLPKDAENSLWAKNSPGPQGDVNDQNYLTAGSLVGINTQGSSMRNANLQLRPDPPITRAFTGIWNQSTIDPDLSRKDLC